MEYLNEVNNPQGAEKENSANFPEPLNQLAAGEAPLNELHLFMRVAGEDSRPLPVDPYSESCVCRNIEKLTGVKPERVHRVNIFDTIIEFAANVSVPAIAQTLHSVRNWQDNPVQISCILGRSPHITEICRQRNISIEQQSEFHQRQGQHPDNLQEKEIELEQQVTQLKEELVRQAKDIKSNALSQGATIAELAHGMDHHASLITKLQEEQGQLESVSRIYNGTVTPSIVTEFLQMQQGDGEGVLQYGSRLECKFRVLQEEFPDRYDDVKLCDHFLFSIVDGIRDAIHYKHSNPKCTFNELLIAAMRVEAESTQRSANAKTLITKVSYTNTNHEINPNQKPSTHTTDVLRNPKLKSNVQKGKGIKPLAQCFRCLGWGHFIRSCASQAPVEGSVEWERTFGNLKQGGGFQKEE